MQAHFPRMLFAIMAALISGCDAADPQAGFDIVLETSHAMAQGDVVEIPVTIRRAAFDGPLTFSVQDLPSGINARFSPSSVPAGGSATTLVLETTGDATPGDVAVVVGATGEGRSVTRTVDVAIHLRGSYTLELLDSSVTVAQGGQGSATILFRRTDNNGSAVSVSLSGSPAGVTASQTMTSTGPGTSIAFSADVSAAAGMHAVTITTNAAGTAQQSATLSLNVVTPPPTTNVTLAFCPDRTPTWFAVRNDGYRWQRVTASGHSFSFNVTERAAIAYGLSSGEDSLLFVTYGTREHFTHWRVYCEGNRSITGTVAGIASGQQARVALGGAAATVTPASPAFTLSGIPQGTFDLVAVRSNAGFGATPDRFILRRGVAPATGTVLPTLDFAAEGIAPATSALEISGLAPDQDLDWQVFFFGAGSYGMVLQSALSDPPPTTAYAFPASALQAADLHSLEVIEQTLGANPFRVSDRGLYKFFAAPQDHRVELGPALPTVQIDLVAASPYPRLRARIASQAAYDAAARVEFYFSPTRTVVVTATAGYLGSTPATWNVVVPDFGALSALGISPAWLFPSVVAHYATVVSSPASVYFGARPTAGDTQRYASTYHAGPLVPLRAAGASLSASVQPSRGAVRNQATRSMLVPRVP